MSKLSILTIDDEDEVGVLICTALSDLYEVDFAPDGFTAQRLIKAKPYDLILCDIHMPHLNGLAVIEELKKKKLKTPVIFVTGDANEEFAKKAFELGAVNLIEKPFSVAELRKKVSRAISDSFQKVQEEDDGQELAYVCNLLKMHYYDFEKMIYAIQRHRIPLATVIAEVQKKERTGSCILDDENYIQLLTDDQSA